MNAPATAIVAEDEPLLRHALCELLATAWPQLQVAAVCADGTEALEAIAEHHPDVAFLDIRMPGLSGLDVASAAAEANPRMQVVFVTAYDQYAIDAFESGAIDYLLKPVTALRLATTIERLRDRAMVGNIHNATLATLARQVAAHAAQHQTQPPLAWITASTGRDTRLIMLDDIIYFRADNKYTTVVTADGEALLRKPIRELVRVLDPMVFRQIHRSTIVNIKAVAAFTRDEGGRGTLRLRERPETLVVSQPFMGLFRAL